MKTVYIVYALLLSTSMTSCNKDNDEINEVNNAQGVIELVGEDTLTVGTELEVGDIAYGREDLTGLEESVIIVSKGAIISEETQSTSPNDPDYAQSIIDFPDEKNGFVIVAGEQLVSIVIITNGVETRYVCDSIFETSISCGSVSINKDDKRVVFTNTTVRNTETGTVLTMNGTLQW